jgi:hypothetical protein
VREHDLGRVGAGGQHKQKQKESIHKKKSKDDDTNHFMKKCSSFQIKLKAYRTTTTSKIVGNMEVARTVANAETIIEEIGIATLVVP